MKLKFKTYIILFNLLFIQFLFTGCIEVKETISVNKDMTGVFSFFIDMSKLKGVLSGVDKYIDVSLMSQLKKWPETMTEKIRDIKGISDVKSYSDDKIGKYGFAFAFKNDRALNKTLFYMLDHGGSILKPNLYKIKKHKFVKRNIGPIMRTVVNKYDDEIKNKSLFDVVDYVCVYKFPSDVIASKNEKYKIIDEKVVFRQSISNLLSTNVNLGNKIKW